MLVILQQKIVKIIKKMELKKKIFAKCNSKFQKNVFLQNNLHIKTKSHKRNFCP